MGHDCIIDDIHGNDTVGEYLGNIIVNKRQWAILVIEGDEDPTLVKASHILVSRPSWGYVG